MLSLKSSPTVETSKRLQQAFDIFNNNLFDGVLPHAMLRIERLKNANGIYRPARYSDTQGSTIAAIALNSTNANERELHLLLSTLVHEMCHQYTHLITNEGEALGGHGPHWRSIMLHVGLTPIKIGITWRQATHQINPDGLFLSVYQQHQRKLEALPWKELANDVTRGRVTGLDKVKFTCPSCGSKIWAKAATEDICGTCSTVEPLNLIHRIPEYRAEGGGGKGSGHRAKAKPTSYEPPSTSPGLPVWTDELGRIIRTHCGIDHPPTSREEAMVVMLFGVKQREPQLYEDLDSTGDAFIAALKAVYKHRARILHPDTGGNEEAFKVLQIAYRILSGGKG